MIRLLQNTKNDVVVTLTELKQNTTTLYLFKFINQMQPQVSASCLAYDSGSYNRYNRFCLQVVSSSADNTNGQISGISGFYHYKVYESPSGSLISTGLNEVESGIMQLSGSIN